MTDTIKIESAVFIWLFNTSGCTKEDIIKLLPKALEPKIDAWLNGSRSPELTIYQIQTLAETYHRPFASFLLSEIPDGEIIPRDFRKNPDATPFSKETFRYFRQAYNDLKIYREMSENLNEEHLKTIRRYSKYADPEETAQKERELLNIPADLKWKNDYEAYKYWREFITDNGIPVFQYSMPQNEARGFVVRIGDYAAIITNSKDQIFSRIFTIFHEYAHLLIGEDCVCMENSDESENPQIRQVENWCNQFAGAFLMPKEAILTIPKIETLLNSGKTIDAAAKISSIFKVSKTAALVRLNKLGLINNTQYKNGYSILNPEEEEEEEEEKTQKEKTSGFVPPEDKCIHEKGVKYITLIERNYNEGHITQADRIRSLNVSQKTAEKVAAKVGL